MESKIISIFEIFFFKSVFIKRYKLNFLYNNRYLRIINGCSSLKLKHVTKNCALLIRDLLQYNVEQRLGCGIRGALDIIEHPWFDQINFWSLYQQKYIAPFLPIHKCIINDEDQNETILKFTAKNQYENEFYGF